jgi:hypothetical protein
MVDQAIQLILKHDDASVKEIIVSENHGTDGSYEHLKHKYENHSKIKITIPSTKGGAITNWKHCLDLATGTHVHWHWSDDWLLGNFYNLAYQKYINQNANVIACCASIFSGSTIMSKYDGYKSFTTLSKKEALETLFSGILPVSPAAYILPIESVRRHFYTDIPDYKEYRPMKIAMGTDALMISGSIVDCSVLHIISDELMAFRSHAESITVQNINQMINYWIAYIYFIKKNGLLSGGDLNSLEVREIFGNNIVDELIGRESFIIESKIFVAIAMKHGLRAAIRRAVSK